VLYVLGENAICGWNKSELPESLFDLRQCIPNTSYLTHIQKKIRTLVALELPLKKHDF
jgi:hypothetical protein